MYFDIAKKKKNTKNSILIKVGIYFYHIKYMKINNKNEEIKYIYKMIHEISYFNFCYY